MSVAHISQRLLQASTGECNAGTKQQYLKANNSLRFLIQGFIFLLQHDLLILTPIARHPKSSEDKTLHSGLPFN